MIDRIEIHVTALSTRLKRIFSSGTYDTGPETSITSKPVLVKIHADGVIGIGQIRPISPGHFVADTTQSIVAAIKEIYGPAMIGRSIFDIEGINEMFDNRLANNPAARAVLDIAIRDAQGNGEWRGLNPFDLVDRLPEPGILKLQLLQSLHLVQLQAAVLLAPTVIGHLGYSDLPHSVGHRGSL